ncbi:hypothetical protein D9M68_690270 [compost metagenome]
MDPLFVVGGVVQQINLAAARFGHHDVPGIGARLDQVQAAVQGQDFLRDARGPPPTHAHPGTHRAAQFAHAFARQEAVADPRMLNQPVHFGIQNVVDQIVFHLVEGQVG